MSTKNNPLIESPDAAAALGVSERILLEWRKNHGLPYVRLGETVLHPVDEVRAWLRAQSIDPEPRAPE